MNERFEAVHQQMNERFEAVHQQITCKMVLASCEGSACISEACDCCSTCKTQVSEPYAVYW
jgi:hypothetical protein